jgi:putative oxidoreductase
VTDHNKAVGLLLGRLLLCPIFLAGGTMKIVNWSKTAEEMSGKGMIFVSVVLAAAIAIELAGGLSILLGFKARLGAIVLALYLIPVTFVFHRFWAYDGAARELQLQHFLKNLTILGGLCTLTAAGAGRFSLNTVFVSVTLRDQLGPLLALHSSDPEGTPLSDAYLTPYGPSYPPVGSRSAGKSGLSVHRFERPGP